MQSLPSGAKSFHRLIRCCYGAMVLQATIGRWSRVFMECTMPATLEPIRSLPAAAHVLRVPRATTPVAMRQQPALRAITIPFLL